MRITRLIYGMVIVAAVALATVSCRKEGELVGDRPLAFSTDTLTFDTVFTTMGSVTKAVMIYNRSGEDLSVDVTLRGGRASRYRLNVDGDTSMAVRGLEIAKGDSSFVFVRVNVNPNSATEPFLVEDFIDVAVEGGEMQSVVLRAFGRNAVYHLPAEGKPYSVIDCEGWDHSRPHVIVGWAVVDSATMLTLTAGDELYFAADAMLWVYNDGCLKVNGSSEQPVLFTALRRGEEWYRDLPGQWQGIWLSAGSKNNEIAHAVIEDAVVGLLVDSNVTAEPTLRLSNARVLHHSSAALVAQGAWVEGENVLMADCGTAVMALQYGGRYSFSHATIANYWKYSARKLQGLVLNNWYSSVDGQVILRGLTEARFENSIIYGNYSAGEVFLDRREGADFNVTMTNCLVKGLGGLAGIDAERCLDEDPAFKDVSKHDYSLEETSPAAGWGYIAN